jgi:hypothetical protein
LKMAAKKLPCSTKIIYRKLCPIKINFI